jgi:hypothetical protein
MGLRELETHKNTFGFLPKLEASGFELISSGKAVQWPLVLPSNL